MKQTEAYKLNLIETSDTFSPAPINENTQAIETQLCTARADAHSAIASLDQRVTKLEAHKVITGTYTGDGKSSRVVSLGFTPSIVWVQPASNLNVMATAGSRASALAIADGGFRVGPTSPVALNTNNSVYAYTAIL